MQLVFQLVARSLMAISSVTGMTYKEVNVVAYYLLLPFVYVALMDKILKRHVLKIVYVAAMAAALLLIPDFEAFSEWLFDASVRFLHSFRAIGLNYVAASVVVCVVCPGIVFLVMLHVAYPRLYPTIFQGRSKPAETDDEQEIPESVDETDPS